MTRDKGAVAVPDLVLERYRLGELPRTEAEALTERLRSDEGLRLRLEALERSDEEIRRRYPSASLAATVRERIAVERGPKPAPGARAGWTFRWRLPAALAVAAALFVVLVPRLSSPPAIAPGVTPQPEETGDR